MRRSRWPVLRRLGFHPGGDERSSFRGAGLEYTDVREYQAGDDPRTIEWNITARSDRPYVRESLPERGLDAWLLIDVTRSLDWGTARCLKRQLALEFSAVIRPNCAAATGRPGQSRRAKPGGRTDRPWPGADRGRPSGPASIALHRAQRFHDPGWLAATDELAGAPPRSHRRLDPRPERRRDPGYRHGHL